VGERETMIAKSSGIQARYSAIETLVQEYVIEDQQTLSDLLNEHYHIKTTQAIICRDLRTLGITKALVKGKSIYQIPSKDIQLEILQLGILDIQHNNYMVVIKTLPALADFLGDFLDAFEDDGILGTLSGENTVFVTPMAGIPIDQFHKTICRLTHFKLEAGEKK
jgi:transcriptional regulator of arginine metabolism